MAQFATAEQLRVRLRLSSIDTEAANALLEEASTAIQDEAHQTIEEVVGDPVELEGVWERALHLPEVPVTAVSTVSIIDPSGFEISMVDGTDYKWNRLGKLLRISHIARLPRPIPGHWGGTHSTVKVTYTHGFDTIPDTVKNICLAVAGRAYPNPEGALSRSVDGHQVSWPREALGIALTEAEKRRLNPFRGPRR